jgi:hypothetical protein
MLIIVAIVCLLILFIFVRTAGKPSPQAIAQVPLPKWGNFRARV